MAKKEFPIFTDCIKNTYLHFKNKYRIYLNTRANSNNPDLPTETLNNCPLSLL